MTQRSFENIENKLYKYTTKNNIDVYLYPFLETKNFYCSISVKFGAEVLKYKKDNEIYDVIPGSAHFLEHRIMTIGESNKISNHLSSLGSIVNAWTSYYATNYNIRGSSNIEKNINILLDLFYNAKFSIKKTEEEKLIISEEIDMCKDNIYMYTSDLINKNVFNQAYKKHSILGEKEDINKITPDYLKSLYEDVYTSNNTFIVICGNFDKDKVINIIDAYYKNKNIKKGTYSKVKVNEPKKVKVNYHEEVMNINIPIVKYAVKIPKKKFGFKEDDELLLYLGIIFKLNFGPSSKNYEKYKKEGISNNLYYSVDIVDEYIMIDITSRSKNADLFIKNIKKDIKNLKINKKDFERIKKRYIKNYFMFFENIENIEYKITNELSRLGKIYFDDYSVIINLSVSKAHQIIEKLEFNNTSILKTTK